MTLSAAYPKAMEPKAVFPEGAAAMTTEEIRALNDECIINTYGTRRLALVRGEGARVWDADGREYLDFMGGIAVAALGHCHPAVTQAITEQARTLVHVSNLYYIEPQVRLAQLLCENTFADRWFFCNSGAEANEAAFKIARRYWSQKGTPKPVIVTAHHSFHGRTLAAVTATGQPKYHEGFEPVMPGFKYVEYDNLPGLSQAITPDVGAVLLEPIQGEGGVRIPSEGYLAGVRDLCTKRGVLLILDEVQTGMGRTGTFFNYMQHGIAPDILTAAKGLGNGVPIGAMGCTEEVSTGFSTGSHASTFGGNPLCSAAAYAAVSAVLAPGFLERAADVGRHFADGLRKLQRKHAAIVEVRAKGLMVGVELNKAVGPLINLLIDEGVIAGPAGPNVLRFVPPLIITTEQADSANGALDKALGQF